MLNAAEGQKKRALVRVRYSYFLFVVIGFERDEFNDFAEARSNRCTANGQKAPSDQRLDPPIAIGNTRRQELWGRPRFQTSYFHCFWQSCQVVPV